MNGSHLRTILWLRSRLSRNQWRRAGRFAAVLRGVLVAGGLLLVLGGTVGGYWLGAVVLPKAPSWAAWGLALGLGLAFLFFWLGGLVAEVQRSEAIEIQRLLHLPVGLGQVFAINYLISLLTPAFLLFLPTLLALAAGLTRSRGAGMAWLFPLILSGLFAFTAWTYCLRGWLVALMVNKRRRRAIVVGATIGIVLLGQVPNLLFNNPMARDYFRSMEREAQDAPGTGDARSRRSTGAGVLLRALPPLDENVLPGWGAASVSLLVLLLGVQGLRRAYAMTLRYYQGVESPRVAQAAAAPPAREAGHSWSLEGNLPGCSEEVSAMTLCFLRSALRAPETKMALVMPLVMVLVFGSMHFGRGGGPMPTWAQPFALTGAVALSLFAIVQMAANLFGPDRDGFRALVLLPVARRRILLAKNLALLPFATGVGVLLIGALALLWRLPLTLALAGVLQLLAGYLLVCMAGNYTSARAPFRVAPGSLKPTKTKATTSFLTFFLYLVFPLGMFPLLIPPAAALMASWLTGLASGLLTFLGSGLLAAAATLAYGLSLSPAGDYLQSREQLILETVTSPIE